MQHTPILATVLRSVKSEVLCFSLRTSRSLRETFSRQGAKNAKRTRRFIVYSGSTEIRFVGVTRWYSCTARAGCAPGAAELERRFPRASLSTEIGVSGGRFCVAGDIFCVSGGSF